LDLAKAASQLDEAVRDFVHSGGKDNAAILDAIFQLNNETGKLLRVTGDSTVRELQLSVNEVTKAAKLRDARRVVSAMDRVRADLARLQSKQ